MKNKKKLVSLMALAVLSLTLLTGCGERKWPMQVTVVNRTTCPIADIRLSLASEEDWGPNRIETVLEEGESVEIDLGEYLRLGRGEELGGGRRRPSILADATESVFAAVYLDGGIGDSLPVFRAMSKGCEKVILVTTKVASDVHPTDYSRVRPLMSRLYKRRYPAFFAALMTRCKRYFAELDEILELEKEGQILVIRPEVCNVKTLEKDAEAMQAFYEHGRAIGEAWLPKIRAYLSEE